MRLECNDLGPRLLTKHSPVLLDMEDARNPGVFDTNQPVCECRSRRALNLRMMGVTDPGDTGTSHLRTKVRVRGKRKAGGSKDRKKSLGAGSASEAPRQGKVRSACFLPKSGRDIQPAVKT